MNKLKRFSAVILSLAILMSVFSLSSVSAEGQGTGQTQLTLQEEYLESARDFIRQKYNGVIPTDALSKAATLNEMFDILDDYSVFFSADEFYSFVGSLAGSVEGVGVQVNQEEKAKYITIAKVYKNSPAWNAGVLSGDQIAEVDGASVAGQALDAVVAKVKGPAGTKVRLGLLRQGEKDIITLEMARASVNIPSVHYEARGAIGYILIDSFSSNTHSGVAEALKSFDDKKITKVVLDLRNNPGGYVDQAVQLAQLFVPQGLITKLDFKDSSQTDETYYSSLSSLKYKLAVLVNENSASASEIFTGAVKDTKAGIVVGSKTFGKAKVQAFYPILNPGAFESLNKVRNPKSVNAYDFTYEPEDSQLAGWAKLTTGLYYTPNGDCIDLKGIEPNVKVEDQKLTEDKVPVNLLEPLTVTVKPRLGTKYTDVFYAEHILKLLNYNVDKPDVTLDSKTVAAIKKFQKDNKVYSYGVLDFCTQKLLNSRLASLKQVKDPVYAKAVQLIK